MESFRVRHSEPGAERTLLLPLSFGSGSTVLLHLLSQHLEGQVEKTGRSGFSLHVLHVDDALGDATSSDSTRVMHFKERFPRHSYSTIPLSDALSVEDLATLLPLVESTATPPTASVSSVQDLMQHLDSPTSRTDAMQILRSRLIVDFAKRQGCEAILWGDSTTRLAERILTETAKGRGYSVPWIVADGESPHAVPFYYPMRDLLCKEILSFVSTVEPSLDQLIVQHDNKPAVNMKDATIDGLMRQYFEAVESGYPSIVANVVKTSSKLQSPSLKDVEMHCELCDLPLLGASPEKSRLCYGCIRTMGGNPV